MRTRSVALVSLLLLSACKSSIFGEGEGLSAKSEQASAAPQNGGEETLRGVASRCPGGPAPVVLFMPGCGFVSCGAAAGAAWLQALQETLSGIVPPGNIRLVSYQARPYPNTGGFSVMVKTAMMNPCYSKVITAGASAGDTIGSHLATHPRDFGLPRAVDAHLGIYGPKQFRYYRDHPELQGVANNAGGPISALSNLVNYAGGRDNARMDRASPQTYARADNPTRVFTSMGTADRRINADTGSLFFQGVGGSRDGFNVLHTCVGGAHGYHFNGAAGSQAGAGFGGGSCLDLREALRTFVRSVIESK